MRKPAIYFLISAIFVVLVFFIFRLTHLEFNLLSLVFKSTDELISPWVENPLEHKHPLTRYTINNLKNYQYQPSKVLLSKEVESNETYTSFLFSFTTMNKTMTGFANIPEACKAKTCPVILLIRGYASKEQYYPGFGTKNAAKSFAENQYITLAPDFFGFAEADPEPEDSWEARFIKPINVIELIKTIQNNPIIFSDISSNDQNDSIANTPDHSTTQFATIDKNKIGIWAHSNGGQITLSVLEILNEPIHASLWAPVTAPFPYSILYFTRTDEDEGKEGRAWLAIFEKDYDVFEFSITQHLDSLIGPIQIHQGSQDKDAPQEWTNSFVEMIKKENMRRADENKEEKLIEYQYFVYPDADHNLLPIHNWQLAIQRDLTFFNDNVINHE